LPHPPENVAAHIDRFLSVEHRHHTLSAADIMRDPAMSGWIADVYSALRQMREHPAPAAALTTLDRVSSEFNRTAPLISSMQRDLRARLQAEMADSKAQAEQRVAQAEQRVAQAEQRVAQAEERAAEAGQRAAVAEQHVAEAEQRVAEAEQHVAEAEQHVGEAEQHVAEAEQRVAEAERQREAAALLAARLVRARAQVETTVAHLSAAPSARQGGGTPAAVQAAPLAEIADVTQWLEGVPLQISLAFGDWRQWMRRRLRQRAVRFIRTLLPKQDTIP
jgi:septal ring factor EnvC (AmiA/AmiB activator)